MALLRQRYLKLTEDHQALQAKHDSLLAGNLTISSPLSSEAGAESPLLAPSLSSGSLDGEDSAAGGGGRKPRPLSLSQSHSQPAQSQNFFALDVLGGIKSLVKTPRFSDINLVFQDGQKIRAHKLILAWRSKEYGAHDLDQLSEIQVDEGVSFEALSAVVKFMYQDFVELPSDDTFLVRVMVSPSFSITPPLLLLDVVSPPPPSFLGPGSCPRPPQTDCHLREQANWAYHVAECHLALQSG